MCGIAGILCLDRGRVASKTRLREMCRLMVHRGPDDEGLFIDGEIGLAVRRLSIIDVAGGRQPIENELGDIHLVCNGEIYNFQELRRDLESKGHRFRSHSDVEVIVHLYEEHGDRCVEHLRGMFAFALWDAKRQRLLLARDRVGKKPLFYRRTGNEFAFGSEIRLLRVGERGTPEVDFSALSHFLSFQYIPSPMSIYEGIEKLPPAHTLSLEPGREPIIRRYWQLDYGPKTSLSFEDSVQHLRELLGEATRLRLISEVPLGAFLSGGIDSAVIVALMTQFSAGQIKTFSIGFGDRMFNESPMAEATARALGTDHRTFAVTPDFLDELTDVIWYHGEPFADPSALPTYLLCREARSDVTVALVGDGGDEAFAGYTRYALNRLAARLKVLPADTINRALLAALSLLPDPGVDRSLVTGLKRFLQSLDRPLDLQNLQRLMFFSEAQKRELFTADFLAMLGPHTSSEALALDWYDDLRAADPLDRTLAHDVAHYLADDLLVKSDIASMAHSLELRSPFLDHKVLEFAAVLPAAWKVKGLKQTKYILREVAKTLVPASVLKRRKRGFSPPVSEWFRTTHSDWLRQILLDRRALDRGIWNEPAVARLIDDHAARRQDHGKRLWALLVLELWFQTYMDTAGWSKRKAA